MSDAMTTPADPAARTSPLSPFRYPVFRDVWIATLVTRFGGKYVLRAPGAMLLEGGFGDGGSMVISEWPDKAAALAFWNSPEYAEAKQLREGVADCQVLLIEAPTING